MDYVNKICKIGQLEKCCRYLSLGENGFQCLKFTGLAYILDVRVKENTIIAKGDNCEGKILPLGGLKANEID